MKRTNRSMSFGVLLCFLAVSPVITSGTGNEAKETGVVSASDARVPVKATIVEITKSRAATLAEEALGLYNEMNLKKFGLSIKAFEYALKGYKYLNCGHALPRY